MNFFDIKSALEEKGFKTGEHSHGILPVYDDNDNLLAEISIEEGEVSEVGEYANNIVVEGSGGKIKHIQTDDPYDVLGLVRTFK